MSRAVFLLFFALSQAACGGAAARPEPAQNAPTPVGDRVLIRTARLTLEVDDETDFERTLDALEALAKEAKGYVSDRSREAIEFRVPAERLDDTLRKAEALGEITHRDVRAQDVTAAVTDLAIRIENLRTLRGRLQALVARAEAVQDVLALEKELGRVTSELEVLEARKRSLDRDVAFSKVNVRLEEEITPGPLGWIPYGLYLGVKWLFVWD